MQVNLITILLLILLLIIIYNYFISNNTENFTKSEELNLNKNLIDQKKLTLYIFLSRTCPHSIDYENLHHKKLIDDLGSEYIIKKIYSDDDEAGLFNKFNIKYVPKGILKQDENVVEVKGQLRSEVVKNAKKMLDNMTTNMTTNIDCTKSIDKKKLLIFLSKTCPHCVNYMEQTHLELYNQLQNNFIFQLIFSDEDNDGLFNKYNVNYVPKGIVISNEKEYEIKGQLNSDNIINADKIKNIEHMSFETDDENNDETNYGVNNEMNYKINYKVNDETNDETNYGVNNEMNYKVNYGVNNETNDETNYGVNNGVNNEMNYKVNYKVNDETNDETNYGVNNEMNYKVNYKVNNETNDETNYGVNNEMINETNNKKKLLVFLSKTCPHCVNYDKITHNKLKKELEDKMPIEKVYEDADPQGLFKKYNVKYIPKCIVISGGMGYEVKGQINKENVLDADKDIIDDDKDIIDDSNKKKLLVFLSKTCPHCVNYDKITHNKLKKELEDKMLIEKIYSDNDTHGLFNKYNIKYVPKGVVISNGKGYEVNGQLKSENIMNADKINNIEQFNNMETDKKKLLVFLSKTCPHCVNYDKITHNKLQKELEDIMPIEKIYDDADPQGLFKKYNVKYIPKCIVISGGMGYEVNGQINKENVLDADKDIIDVSNKKKLLVFLSKTCPHCITYEKETHDKLLKELLKELNNEIMIEKVYADNDTQGLFNKYNINYVPAGILLSRERHIPIEGIINTENIKEQIKNL